MFKQDCRLHRRNKVTVALSLGGLQLLKQLLKHVRVDLHRGRLLVQEMLLGSRLSFVVLFDRRLMCTKFACVEILIDMKTYFLNGLMMHTTLPVSVTVRGARDIVWPLIIFVPPALKYIMYLCMLKYN